MAPPRGAHLPQDGPPGPRTPEPQDPQARATLTHTHGRADRGPQSRRGPSSRRRPPHPRSRLVSRTNRGTKRRRRGPRALTPTEGHRRDPQAAWQGGRPPSLHPRIATHRGPRGAPGSAPPAPLPPARTVWTRRAAPSDATGPPPQKTPREAVAPSAVPGRSLHSRTWGLCGRKSRPHGGRRRLIRSRECSVRVESGDECSSSLSCVFYYYQGSGATTSIPNP